MILPVPVPSTNMHTPLYKSLVSGISARARYKKTKEESITRTRENKTTLGITNGTRHRPHNPHAACRMALARFPPWHVATYVGHVQRQKKPQKPGGFFLNGGAGLPAEPFPPPRPVRAGGGSDF